MVRWVCSRTAPVVRQHHRGHAPTALLIGQDERTRRCTTSLPACTQRSKSGNAAPPASSPSTAPTFPPPAGLSSYCQDCQRASSRLASRRRQAAVRLLIAFHPEEYQALLGLVRGHRQLGIRPRGGGRDAA
jgi:hypothetical protein